MLRAYLDLFDINPVEKADVSEIGKWLQNNQPVYFKDVHTFRGVGNLWAARDRIAAALHRKKEAICETLVQAIEHPVPCEKAENAPVLKNSRDIDLKTIPIPSTEDISLAGVVITEHKKRIMRFHPFTRLKKNEIVIQVPPHVAMDLCPDMPVAICGGVCPSILLAAVSCQYENELEIASALRCMTLGEPVYTAEVDGLHIPAFSEFVLLGKTTKKVEGPSKDTSYDSVREQAVVHIDKIYHADDPLMHFLLPGGHEHSLLTRMAGESALFKGVRQVAHVVSVRLTEEGGWSRGVISITQQKKGDARNVVRAAFAAHPAMKQVVIVDDDIDIFDNTQVEWALATRFQADRDLIYSDGTGGSCNGSPSEGSTNKVGFDATR